MLWLLFLVTLTVATTPADFLKEVQVSLDDLLPEVANLAASLLEEQLFLSREALYVTSKLDDLEDEKYLTGLRLLAEERRVGQIRRDEGMSELQAAARNGHKNAKILVGIDYLLSKRYNFDDYWETKTNFEKLSLEGVADAQMGLGYLYATETELEQAKAIVYYTFAAEGGNPFAQMAMGYRYSYGVGVAKSCYKAVEYYHAAATFVANGTRFSSSLPEPRMRLTDEIDPDVPKKSLAVHLIPPNEMEYYKSISEQSDWEITTSLGYMYLTGKRGVPQNYQLAIRYLEQAEREGDATARTHLATMYLDGTPQTRANNVTAFTKFYEAAQDGQSTALCGLGHMYLFGLGVEPDRGKAIKLFLRAAEDGNPIAHLYLGFSYETSALEGKFMSALKHYQTAAQGGQVLAVYNLGLMYYKGRGVTRSCETATRFFRQVAEAGEWSRLFVEAAQAYQNGQNVKAAKIYKFLAELGYETAQLNYAHLLDRRLQINGTAARREAVLWWKRAAEQHSVYARNQLGDYYYREGNLSKAVEQYQYAAENYKSPRAFFNLALMYEAGKGLAKDLNMADTYFNLAEHYNPAAVFPVQLALFKMRFVQWLEVFHWLDTNMPHWDLCFLGGFITVVLLRIRALTQ